MYIICTPRPFSSESFICIIIIIIITWLGRSLFLNPLLLRFGGGGGRDWWRPLLSCCPSVVLHPSHIQVEKKGLGIFWGRCKNKTGFLLLRIKKNSNCRALDWLCCVVVPEWRRVDLLNVLMMMDVDRLFSSLRVVLLLFFSLFYI